MKVSIVLNIVFFCFVLGFKQDVPCQHRDFGQGSTVCVCNVTHCDHLPTVTRTSPGLAVIYSTSKSGDRFASCQLHFAKQSNFSNSITTVTINRDRKFQKIIGFGGAFSDAAGINLASLPKELQSLLIRDYFAKDGLEYNMARVPLAGSDFSTRAYSYDDYANDDNFTKFALQPEDFKYKIPYIKMAQEYSNQTVKLFGSAWSAPAWMKTNHELNHGGFLIGQPGGKYYKLFAEYTARSLQEYMKHNVTFWGVTVVNEPNAGYDSHYGFNCLGFNSTQQRDYVKQDLGSALQNSGFENVKVMIYDDNIVTGHKLNLLEFANTVLSDADAAKYVAGVAFHWYTNTDANRNHLDQLHHHFPDHFLLSTEATWGLTYGNWDPAQRYANDILKDLNHFSTGWVDWNLVLDVKGGPNWVNNFNGAAVLVNATSHEYHKQPAFYVVGHFSKFLPAESTRLHYTVQSEKHGVDFTVFQRPDNGTVLIVHNTQHQPVNIRVHDSTNGFLKLTVKADSIQTIIWF